jgi:hypothetical protein
MPRRLEGRESADPVRSRSEERARGRRGGRDRLAFAGVLFAATVAAILLAVPSVLPPSPAAESGLVASESIPPWNTWTCNPPNLSPAALEIPLTGPNQTQSAGAVLAAAYEFKVDGFVSSGTGATVHLPSADAVFRIRPSGDLTLTIPSRNVTIAGRGWSSPTLLAANKTLSAATTFGTSDAALSTAKYAVMADVASGSLTLEFRWRWSMAPSAGTAFVNSSWSVPSKKASSPSLPSIFFPAPYVGVVSTSGLSAMSGTNFTAELDGAVANTSFRVVLEFPRNGTEIQSVWANTTANASRFNATVPLSRSDGAKLHTANYLVHVHDVCGAIVEMFSLQVTHGTIRFPGALSPQVKPRG